MAKAKIANPRWLWLMAMLVGAVCIGAFAHAMLVPPDAGAPASTRVTSPGSGRGFGAGLVIGIATGIAVGFAIARQRSVAVEPHGAPVDHSSRKSP